jgi:23S rRNA (cytosine1962-C5)-methyltransferase
MNIKTLVIKAGFAKPFWAGNPLVYPRAIETLADGLGICEWVRVCDHQQQIIGYGVYNEDSLYRVRILLWAHEGLEEGATLETVLNFRLAEAIALRTLLNLPSPQTNAFRVVNSEGDKLSGVTIDQFADKVVISITARWVLVHLAVVQRVLAQTFPGAELIWRFVEKSLRQDGWKEEIPVLTPESTQSKHCSIVENDITYGIDPWKGQKTGFYCDQRETRALVRELAKGRRVLDLYCFNGGMAMNAAKGGAEKVIGVDTSEAAIAQAIENKKLNELENIEFIEQEAAKSLEGMRDVDFIILDPPKVASNKSHAKRGLNYYLELNTNALQKLSKNGLLLTCSCSPAISLADFEKCVLDSARAVKKQLQLLRVGGAGPDHPLDLAYPEGRYLKWLLLRVI